MTKGDQEIKWYEDDIAYTTYVNRNKATSAFFGLDYTRPLGKYIRMSLRASAIKTKQSVEINDEKMYITAIDRQWQIDTSIMIEKGFGDWGSLSLTFSPWTSRTNQYFDTENYYYSTKSDQLYQYLHLSFNVFFLVKRT